MAVLLHEKVVRSMQGKLRRHELMNPSAFTEKVEKLMASGTNVKSKSSGKPPEGSHKESSAHPHARSRNRSEGVTFPCSSKRTTRKRKNLKEFSVNI